MIIKWKEIYMTLKRCHLLRHLKYTIPYSQNYVLNMLLCGSFSNLSIYNINKIHCLLSTKDDILESRI